MPLKRSSLFGGMLGTTRRADAALRDEAPRLIDYVGVGAHAGEHASQLSFGMLKRLEIARALAGKPRLLLPDELAASLNDTETHEIPELIRQIAGVAIGIQRTGLLLAHRAVTQQFHVTISL